MITNNRIAVEECDTAGANDCCDANCKIITDPAGCTCTHFYIGIWHQTEYPSFQSLCVNPDDEAYAFILPTNTFYFQNRALSQNPTVGMNGQLRIMECSDAATDCFGVTLGQQGAGSQAGGSFVDQWITLIQTSNGGSVTDALNEQTVSELRGKQRNIFGSYLVYNKDLDQIQFDKLTSGGLGAKYTVAAESAVEYLGAHEFYWWGWGSKLLAKLSDGVSFKFLRVANDFDTVAANGSPTDVEKIEQKQTNLFQNAYKTIVPPVFV